jgi:hypothetical protein
MYIVTLKLSLAMQHQPLACCCLRLTVSLALLLLCAARVHDFPTQSLRLFGNNTAGIFIKKKMQPEGFVGTGKRKEV